MNAIGDILQMKVMQYSLGNNSFYHSRTLNIRNIPFETGVPKIWTISTNGLMKKTSGDSRGIQKFYLGGKNKTWSFRGNAMMNLI